jgi:hypothetical protein
MKHGPNKTLTHNIWCKMRRRCYDSKCEQFPHYGGRGISVCDRWRESFVNFISDMGECPKGMTIERRDNDGNYEPRNCRWATRKEQARNRRSSRLVLIDGRVQSLAAWVDEFGQNYQKVHARISALGWGIERALKTP